MSRRKRKSRTIPAFTAPRTAPEFTSGVLGQCLQNTDERCFLYGSLRVGVVMFKPFNSQAYGAPEGKTRYIFYALCRRCSTLPGWQQFAERKLMAERN